MFKAHKYNGLFGNNEVIDREILHLEKPPSIKQNTSNTEVKKMKTHEITNSTWILFLIKKQQGQREASFQQWKWMSGRPDMDNISSGTISFIWPSYPLLLPVRSETVKTISKIKITKSAPFIFCNGLKTKNKTKKQWQFLDNFGHECTVYIWKSSLRADAQRNPTRGAHAVILCFSVQNMDHSGGSSQLTWWHLSV